MLFQPPELTRLITKQMVVTTGNTGTDVLKIQLIIYTMQKMQNGGHYVGN